MRAAGAVEEVEVQEHAASRRGRGRSGVATSSGRRTARRRARRPVARRTTSDPGVGGTKTSGSKRVVEHLARPRPSRPGARPSAIRNTSESKRAPSWRARTCVTTPDSRTGCVAPRHAALADDDVVELEVLLGRDRDPERQRRGVFGARGPGRPVPPAGPRGRFARIRSLRCRLHAHGCPLRSIRSLRCRLHASDGTAGVRHRPGALLDMARRPVRI